MKNLKYMEDNDTYISKSASSLRANTTSGILTGLEVSQVATTYALQVNPGAAVISGHYFELTKVYDGLMPRGIVNGTEIFLAMRLVTTTSTTTNRYGDQVDYRTDYDYVFDIVSARDYSDYIAKNTSIILAHCRYSITNADGASSSSSVQLPRNVFGVFDSLSSASDPAFTSKLKKGDSIAVRIAYSGTHAGEEAVVLYSWEPKNDPVPLIVPHPEVPSQLINVTALWGLDAPGAFNTSKLRYWVPALDPITNPTGHAVVVPGSPDYSWVLASSVDHGVSAQYFYSLIGAELDIDMTPNRYAFIAPGFSGVDTTHRSKTSGTPTPRNIHGLRFQDIGYSVMPLHKQLFDRGFGVAEMETHGIMGQLYEETIDNVNVQTDYFGNITGVLGNKYIKTKHVPTGVSYLLESQTGNNVAYALKNDIVELGVDFVGGSFSLYPYFNMSTPYGVGDRVVHNDSSGIDRLYQAILPWVPPYRGPDEDGFDESYFKELERVDLAIGYYYISDLEYYSTSDNSIYVRPNNNDSIVTEGQVVDPVAASSALVFNLGQYKGISIPSMVLSYSSSGTVVSSETVVDRANIDQRKSSKQLSVNFNSSTQVKVYASSTPFPRELAVPEGRIVVVSKAIYGRYRMFYTYGVDSRTVFVSSTQVTSYPEAINLDSAQLVEDVNYIPRDSWEYSKTDKKVIIAGDVYRGGRNYMLVRNATESARNRRGYVEIVGTAPKPQGQKAQAHIKISEYARLALGDSISITDPKTSKTITKTAQAVAGYTGFEIGSDIPTTYQNIIDAFELDPVFVESNMVASIEPQDIVIVSGIAGDLGNSGTILTTSINTSLVASGFSGGSEYASSLKDLVGLEVTIQDYREPDSSGVFSLWCTGNIDANASNSMYYRVKSVVDSGNGSVSVPYTTNDAKATYGDLNSLDLTQEFSVSVQITGTDPEGNSIQETCTLDYSNFCDIPNYRVENPYACVRTKSIYSSITSWACLDIKNAGSTVITLIAEAASGTRDLFEICDVQWTGSHVLKLRDRRLFVDASTNKPTSDVSAEALSNVAALLQLAQ